MDFYSADTQLHHRRHGTPMQRRKIANNTYLERLGNDEIGLLLHSTYIATFIRDGSVVLDTGGWKTVTTKDRLSYVSGWSVFSARHHPRAASHWWLRFRDGSGWNPDKRTWIPFFDGIHVHQKTGAVLSADEELEQAMEDRDPGPNTREQLTDYLSFILQPDQKTTFGKDWVVNGADPTTTTVPRRHVVGRIGGKLDMVEMFDHQPHLATRAMLDQHYFDMGVAMEAIKMDIAVRGELERSPHWEAMEWAQLMAEGKEPPRFRSIIRRFVNYHVGNA